MSTLTELRALVLARIDVLSNDTGLVTGTLDGFINAALKKVSLAADWEWLDAVATGSFTAGSGAIAAQTGMGRVQYLVLTDVGEEIRRTSRLELARIPSTSRGRPWAWAWDGTGAIEVRPTPDVAYPYELRFYKTEPALTVAGTSPLIPTAYDDGVVEYAAYLAFRFLHRREEAQGALDAYKDWFREARDDATRGRGGLKVRARPGGFV